MHVLFLAAVTLFGMQDIETSPEAKTQLYVKTVPSGAEVTLDGRVVGKSDKLFDATAGVHKLAISLPGYIVDERTVEVRDGEITRVEVTLKKRSDQETVLSYVGETSSGKRSFADSGHAVAFERPAGAKSIVAVKLFGTRYGYPSPPRENFHIYLLDQNQKVLEHIAVPYSKVERGEMKWQTFEFSPVNVPEKFMVAFWFNAEATKGVFVGMDKNASGHSYAGLPDKGYQKLEEPAEWMIRAVVTPDEGKEPTHPKVKTYEDEKADDTESNEAQPEENGGAGTGHQAGIRTWNDSTGAFSVEAALVGVEEGMVKLKKADGRVISVPLDRLSPEDQEYAKRQNGKKSPEVASTTPKQARELSHDNGNMAGKRSIAGGGHAVKFHVDGDSNYVTSVSLHGSRYGMPQPPREDFRVWLCDSEFKPIATFKFRYGAFVRGNPSWKSFKIKPTKVPQDFYVCFAFNPQQTKGVYVSHDGQKSETSVVGVPGQYGPEAFAEGNWLIRCKVEDRGRASAKRDDGSVAGRVAVTAASRAKSAEAKDGRSGKS